MRTHVPIPSCRRLAEASLVLLGGCWLSDAEILAKYGDTARPDTDADTDADSDSDTDVDTDADTDTDVDTDTDTDADLACVDQDLGSATGIDLATGGNAVEGDDFTPDCGGASLTGGLDVALAWTAPAAGCYGLRTAGSTYDTVAYVLDGCSGAELACNDDYSATINSSEVSLELAAGQTIVLVVDAYDANASGTWWVDIAEGTAITADLDAGSAIGNGAASGSNTSADTTLDAPICPEGSGKDVIVRWVAPSSDVWTFELDPFNTSFDAVLSLHRQCGIEAFTCQDVILPYGGEQVTALMYAGEEVFVRIAGYDDGAGPETGSFRLDITN